ncbi:MAG: biotin/lipoyl-containing protein, partial [Rhodospirillaceae bacterium]
MPIEILMPALSPTMTEGTLAKWNVKEGDAVSSGDVLAEIETDKATMELEAVDEGTIGKILVPAGSSGVAVNTPIALLLEEGEDASALAAAPAPKPAAPPQAEPKPAPAAAPAAPAAAPVVPDLGSLGLGALGGGSPAPQAAKPAGERVFASPLARRIAAEAKLDLSRIAGSGPRGRIVKADVEAAKAHGGAEEVDDDLAAAMALALAVKAPEPAAKPKPAAPAADYGTPFTETPHSTIRKVIARRLSESKQTVPHFYITMEVQLDELLALR